MAEAAAARSLKANDIAGVERVIRVARWNNSCLICAGVQSAVAGLAVEPAVDALRRHGVFGRTERKSRIVIQQLVLTDESQPAAKFSRPPGIRD